MFVVNVMEMSLMFHNVLQSFLIVIRSYIVSTSMHPTIYFAFGFNLFFISF